MGRYIKTVWFLIITFLLYRPQQKKATGLYYRILDDISSYKMVLIFFSLVANLESNSGKHRVLQNIYALLFYSKGHNIRKTFIT